MSHVHPIMHNRRSVLATSLGAMAASIIGAPAVLAASAEPIADTTGGRVRGEQLNGVYRFRGVRYGEDTGPRRFLPALPAQRREGVADALAFGNRCAQPSYSASTPFKLYESWFLEEKDSEDCLFLNIWTPGIADGKKRPVMVWLHGGGMVLGSGNLLSTDGEWLSRRNDVVVITVTHRLGLFGYSQLADVLGEDYADAANVGMLDQILALQWVRDNAAAFGGDPGNVTIYGESGGGTKVWSLMHAPQARGLFHRAIVQSNSLLHGVSTQEANETTIGLLVTLGLKPSDAAQLKTLPYPQLLAAMSKMFPAVLAGVTTYGPVIDGRALPWQLDDPRAVALSADVPMMVGSTLTESTILLGGANAALFDLPWEGLAQRVVDGLKMRWGWRNITLSEAEALVAGARRLMPDATPSDLFFRLTTEVHYRPRAEQMATAGERRAPSYVYVVEFETPAEGGKWRSPHSIDVPLCNDTVHLSRSFFGDGMAQAQALANVMSATWASFARTGKPQAPTLPEWKPFDTDRREMMLFDTHSKLASDPYHDLRMLIEDTVKSPL